MNYSKILNWIFGIMAFIGFILIIGAIGASDYAVEMHIYEPIIAHMKEIVIGVILIILGIIYLKITERGDET
jgi:uncharacterized membrane protein